MRFVAITSCPTGIAHTYMAAEGLEQAAAAGGHEITVETQGSAGSEPLDPATIAAADAVIIAADVQVSGRERFGDLPVIDAGVKVAISDADSLISQAIAAAESRKAAIAAGAPVPTGQAPPGGAMATKVSGEGGFGTKLRQWLMTGVSYLIPFVAAGGLLIALSFALGGYEITEAPPVIEQFDFTSLESWAALMFQAGALAFGFLVPVLAGFIAYAMADRPALAPGFVAGAIANVIGAGFLGGLIGGLLAGGLVLAMKRVEVPRALRGIMPVVVYPLLGSLLVAILMYLVVGKPIAALTDALTQWLDGLAGANAALLGAVIGLMMAFDMGGPVNKVAYAFGLAGIAVADPTQSALQIMAAVMAAGMVPPLALALASTVRPKLFTEIERDNGRAAWVMGASFITEGAIPFAAADPLRVIPSIMAGSAVTGALSMVFECTLRAPHGGISVIPLIGNALLYLLAIVIGMVVAATLVIIAKSTKGEAVETSESRQAVSV